MKLASHFVTLLVVVEKAGLVTELSAGESQRVVVCR